jgi:hypothetical protein
MQFEELMGHCCAAMGSSMLSHHPTMMKIEELIGHSIGGRRSTVAVRR